MKIKIAAGGNREEFEEACNEHASEGYFPIDRMQIINVSPNADNLLFYYRQQWALFEREEEKQVIKDMRLVYV